MDIEVVVGRPVRFRPGRLTVRLGERHRLAYKRLYATYRTLLDDLPVLREGDFDGKAVHMRAAQLEALNRGFASLATDTGGAVLGVFDGQEQSKSRLSKKVQYLS
ncbi:MAG: hypothetical protein M3P30_03610 [Chloroflexota bacterium]|nr:hypothetical protein [Chloroflexota bacterium]